MKILCSLLLLALTANAAHAPESLDAVRAEPRLERRSERALDFAQNSLARLKDAAKAGDTERLKSVSSEMADAVELSLKSLRETGHKPQKLTRQYKRGEQTLRDLIKRLDGVGQDLTFEEREITNKLKERAERVHEEFLLGIMSKK